MPDQTGSSTAPDAVRVQILATEHWSLLATRQLAWTEAFSRANIFLTVLSATVVALALVRQAGGSEDFNAFALVLLPVVLFLGLATAVRLGSINVQEVRLVAGMNRLRHGYLDIAPDLEPYFITGHYDDMTGVGETLGLPEPYRPLVPLRILMSTPGVIGIIDCVLAGVLSSLMGRAFGLSSALSATFGVVCALTVLSLMVVLPIRGIRQRARSHRPMFPR
jgi:hypothetical protein